MFHPRNAPCVLGQDRVFDPCFSVGGASPGLLACTNPAYYYKEGNRWVYFGPGYRAGLEMPSFLEIAADRSSPMARHI